MSSRDELREALAEHFYVEVHGRSVASWSEVVVMENADRTWHIAAVYRAKADAVLAVLDQQGWPQDCPTVEAAEPVPPVGTASLLGTPLAAQLQERRQDIAMAICRAECDPDSDFGFHDDMDCSGKGADAVVGYLSVALREAARYKPYAWCHGDEGPIERMTDENEMPGCERCVPLYRQVTTAGEDS